jgi:hypothetical protein
MIELLLTLLAFVATAICVGLYWQVQKSEARVARQAAEVREQALVVGELADEISMASTYLYEAMDRFLGDVETQLQAARELTPPVPSPSSVRTSVEEKAAATPEPTPMVAEEEPAWWELLEEDEAPDITVVPEPKPEATPVPYHPHYQALALAAEGKDLVEIARQTGLGVEELRLLLHFQDELSVSG